MLKVRVIPCLDVKGGRIVKGINFESLRDAGDPVEQAQIYCDSGADELCFLDIAASYEQRTTLYEMVERVARVCFIPFTVGGGVSKLDDIRRLLMAGADKVTINTSAVNNPELVQAASEKFGSQCIVVAIDAKRISTTKTSGSDATDIAVCNEYNYGIFTHGGRTATGIDAVQWARKMAEYGAGELLVTSMDRDGTKQGYDIKLMRKIADSVAVPVIASGGVGKLQHMVSGIIEGHASAVLAASIFHFGEYTIHQVKQAMAEAGIAIRN